jgi:hypothetical protein
MLLVGCPRRGVIGVEPMDARLEIELDLKRRGVEGEVMLLEALSEQALRRTHRRYFEDAQQIVRQPIGE